MYIEYFLCTLNTVYFKIFVNTLNTTIFYRSSKIPIIQGKQLFPRPKEGY